MSAKQDILDRIRNAHALSQMDKNILDTGYPVTREYHTTHDYSREQLKEILIDRLEDYKAIVKTATKDTQAHAIAEALAEQDARNVTYAPGLHAELFSESEATFTADDNHRDPRLLNDVDAVVTSSTVTSAQTGTICLQAGPACGRRALTLVPDCHVCIVDMDTVVYGVPEMIKKLNPAHNGGNHSPVTMISGPSATSDIELNRVEGVHGPRRLIVIIVD